MHAYRHLLLDDSPASPTAAKRQISAAVRATAQQLGNTPTVCRQSYVHPRILEAYTEGSLHRPSPPGHRRSRHPHLVPEGADLLHILGG